MWLACGAGFIALVIYFSLEHDPPNPGRYFDVKIGHVAAYAWLMLWFAQIYESARARWSLAAGFCAMGVGLEFAQAMTDYRTFAVADMIDNGIGVAIGFMLGLTALGRVLLRVERLIARG